MPDTAKLPTTPPAASAAATPAGWWWCPHCKVEVGSYHVTNAEMHEDCGHPVEWKKSAASALPVRSATTVHNVRAVTITSRRLDGSPLGPFWALDIRLIDADGVVAQELTVLTEGDLAPLLTTPDGQTGLRTPAAGIIDLTETTDVARAEGQRHVRETVR